VDLIDRYVNEIARRLPRSKRADVREELRSALNDALDSRVEGEPNEEDVVALLEEFGRPTEVAASYSDANRYLIGPPLYPVFKLVVSVALPALAAVLVFSFALSVWADPSQMSSLGAKLLSLLGGIFQTSVLTLGTIVLVFALLQRLDLNPDDLQVEEEVWNPRDLPVVADVDLVGRGEALTSIVFAAVFMVVVNLFRDRLGLMLTPGQKVLFSHIVVDNLLWIKISLLLGMALHTWLLWAGRWRGLTRIAKIGCDLFGVYVVYRVARAVVADKAALFDAGLPGPLPEMISMAAHWLPVIVAVVVLFDAAKVLYRLAIRSSETPPTVVGA